MKVQISQIQMYFSKTNFIIYEKENNSLQARHTTLKLCTNIIHEILLRSKDYIS